MLVVEYLCIVYLLLNIFLLCIGPLSATSGKGFVLYFYCVLALCLRPQNLENNNHISKNKSN